MTWCVMIELPGESPRVVGSFNTRKRADGILWMVDRELERRDVDRTAAVAYVQEMLPGGNWRSVLPWL